MAIVGGTEILLHPDQNVIMSSGGFVNKSYYQIMAWPTLTVFFLACSTQTASATCLTAEEPATVAEKVLLQSL